MVMQKLVMAGIVVAVLLASVSLAQSAEKKKKATSTPASKSTATTTGSADAGASDKPVVEAGWTIVKVNAPDLVRVTYKLDGSSILVRFLNLTRDKAVRVKYHAKWKKDWNGRMVDDATADGLSVRLKKGEEFPLDIRTGAKGVKDIVFTIDASEIS
jgi:hypothetical protein